MKKLEMNEMARIEGGGVESCRDYQNVRNWLRLNGHDAQLAIVDDLYYDQYCGAVD